MNNKFSRFLARKIPYFLLALLVLSVGPLMAQKAKKTATKPLAGTAAPQKPETITTRLGLTFVKIPPGSFIMGSPSGATLGECPDCSGAGKRQVARTHNETNRGDCSTCGGRGEIKCSDRACDGKGFYTYVDKGKSFNICSHCAGRGKEQCYSCKGSGRGSFTRTITEGYDTRICSECKGKGKRLVDSSEGSDEGERPSREVTITRPYWIQTTVVTQKQWKAMMGSEPWKNKWCEGFVATGDEYPATGIDWYSANIFIQKLNKMDEGEYRLPSEAEWEFACRAGTTTKYCFGNDASKLKDYAWIPSNTVEVNEAYPHKVAQKKPNQWGIYDMHGNVDEWCLDGCGNYSGRDAQDPILPPPSDNTECRRVRGSGHDSYRDNGKLGGARSAYRMWGTARYGPRDVKPTQGFRVVRIIN